MDIFNDIFSHTLWERQNTFLKNLLPWQPDLVPDLVGGTPIHGRGLELGDF